MTNLDEIVLRIATVVREPSRRTENGLTFPVLDEYPPVKPEMLASAESRLGFELPDLLRQCYLRIGNGGFGPAHGIIGLDNGYPDDLSHACLPELYEYFRQNSDDPWPRGVLPLFVMGCGFVDSIDCLDPKYPVLSMEGQLEPVGFSFNDYMINWLTDMERRQI